MAIYKGENYAKKKSDELVQLESKGQQLRVCLDVVKLSAKL